MAVFLMKKTQLKLLVMKTLKQPLQLSLLLILTLSLSFCSKDDGTEPGNPDTESINAYFRAIPNWEINETIPKDDVYKDSVVVQGTTDSEEYECPIFERNIVTTIKNFVSVGTNFGTIWPGALIQGNSLATGELQLINANQKRAPITLTTNLTLGETSKTIDPNSTTAQQAIADFKIAAGEMPEGSQGGGTMNFQVIEASTFEQSMQQMGISAGFTEPQSSVGLDGSLSVEKSRSSFDHTVVAQFVQEMFTVRVADDLIPTPADFFTSDFSGTDIEKMENAGEIGDENIPIYIESVTYGRLLLFSMRSESVASGGKLETALRASMAQYANAEGELSEEHEEIFRTASHRIYSAGGSQEGANAAIANLDWSRFFVKSTASEAVPISFVAKTLKGKKIVGLVNSATFDQRDNCSLLELIGPPAPEIESYDIIVTWTKTDNTGACIGGSFGTCRPDAFVKLEREDTFTTLTAINSFQRSFNIPAEGDYTKFTVRSLARLAIPWPYQGFTTKSQTTTLNAASPNLTGGNNTYKHTLTNFAGSVTFTYNVRKVINYK